MHDVIQEERTVKRKIKVGEKITCDSCGKVIYEYQEGKESNFKTPLSYYSLTTGHHDWGNDSIESIHQMDLCSDLCLMREIDNFLTEEKLSSTKYFNVTSETAY